MRQSHASRRGATLIVVLGVLVVLALLGTTFASLQSVERDVSRNYLDHVRATLVATSGIEFAVAQVSADAERGTFYDPAMQYWGDNVGETGSPDLITPLEKAQNPSYAFEDEKVQDPGDPQRSPMLFEIDGKKKLGISGMMTAGRYAPNGDVYRLRVTDANSLLHVNDGVENGINGYVSRNLRRILNNLGEIVGVAGAGDKVLERRPTQGYSSKRELLAVFTKEEYEKISPFLTTVAWTDGKVCNPVPYGTETISSYPVPYNGILSLYRYGRSHDASGKPLKNSIRFAPDFANPQGHEHAVMALDEVNAQWIEICRRAPVNVNQAPKEILTALLVGLRGVFMTERRKYNPSGGMYSFLIHERYDNAPGKKLGDEYGYLYATVPFVADRGSTTNGIPASKVADEILACRGKQRSPHLPGVEYAKVWYGGPFRTWRQFDGFCDGLVTGGLLVDKRPIYFDYEPKADGRYSWLADPSGSDKLVSSPIQPKFAAQALADVLKANFNPNLTLNEINPDANLYRIVDKSDLIVNSTEFCFTPMGVYDVESEGLILRTEQNENLVDTKAAKIVSRSKILCSVRVFDAYRETTQSEFYEGELESLSSGTIRTNNNRRLEIGPEPDNGALPKECQWGGWIQLATVGGHRPEGDYHTKGEVEETPPGSAELGETLCGHFALDHRLNHHAAREFDPIRDKSGTYRNNADRTETAPGPYGPADKPAGRYRLARDWNQKEPPSYPELLAVSDLRLDGAYVERDSALMYRATASVFDIVGTAAYWVKPSYHPEMTGKPRTYFCNDVVAKSSSGRGSREFQLINGQWFFPSHDSLAFVRSKNEFENPRYAGGPWRPASFVCGYSTKESYGGGVGFECLSLNHRGHDGKNCAKYEPLRHHEWIHVAYQWDMTPGKHKTFLVVNGTPAGGAGEIKIHPQNANQISDFIAAPIRLGEPSKTMEAGSWSGGGVVSRNWAADATLDEFYLWMGDRRSTAQDLWALGRYYRPLTGFEGSFTSRKIRFDASHRNLAPRMDEDPPEISGTTLTRRERILRTKLGREEEKPGTTTTGPEIPDGVRILAAAWTWHPEWVDADGRPLVHDHNLDTDHVAEVELQLLVDGTGVGPVLQDDRGSGIPDLHLMGGQTLQYRVRFRIPEATPDTILLATPVFDDITLYTTTGIQYMSFMVIGESL